MAIIKACTVSNKSKNTGKECDVAMGATAMLIATKPTFKWTLEDLEDPDAWLEEAIHDQNAFPLFGIAAPINTITNDTEADVEITLDDGLKVFLRYGVYNRTLATTKGGLCYAAALMSFLNTGYDLVEIDQTGQMLQRQNDDGTFSGLHTSYMKGLAPTLADFKTSTFMNRFSYSFSPIELVNNGKVFTGASSLLDAMGLIDAIITEAAPATTTLLKIGVMSECAETDLVALLSEASLEHVNNFIVTNKATGVVVTITAVNKVAGHLELVGTFVSGQTYTVVGSAPSLWYANDAVGYDATFKGVDILIP